MERDVLVKKLKMKSRRGMLELDLLLTKFCNNELLKLSLHHLHVFDRFLDEEDDVLFRWLMGHEACPIAEFEELITSIV